MSNNYPSNIGSYGDTYDNATQNFDRALLGKLRWRLLIDSTNEPLCGQTVRFRSIEPAIIRAAPQKVDSKGVGPWTCDVTGSGVYDGSLYAAYNKLGDAQKQNHAALIASAPVCAGQVINAGIDQLAQYVTAPAP
jgi:hypothetical protein